MSDPFNSIKVINISKSFTSKDLHVANIFFLLIVWKLYVQIKK